MVATAAYAVDQLPEKEEDIPVEFIPKLDTIVSVGLHHLLHGPKVTFGNLGHIAQTAIDSSDTTDTISKSYTNGSISKDGLTAYEKDAYGKQLASGTTFRTSDFISVTQDAGNGNRVVTIYTGVATPETNPDGSFVINSDGSYVPVTTPTEYTNSDGSTTITQNEVMTWASTSKILGYKDGQTRYWSVQNPNQINYADHTVSMSTYGVVSKGESREADSSGSTGFDVSIERQLGHRGRLEWGVSAGLKLVDINAKAAGIVDAYLTRTMDVYKMIDTGLNTSFYNSTVNTSQPTGDAANAADLPLIGYQSGNSIYEYLGSYTSAANATAGADQSVVTPLDTTPIKHSVLDGSNAANAAGLVHIHGFWQLKGAYYQAQFGPTFRYRFNDRWALSASAGFALGWVGTTFRADEQYDNSVDVTLTGSDLAENARIYADFAANPTVYRVQEKNTTHKFLPGYYYEFNAEYWVTEQTGFYFGVSQQAMRSYSQSPLSERTAKVDMGSSAGWRIGIITRF
jgi:hypothetical protein